MHALQAELVEQRRGQLRVEGQAVFLRRLRAPLAQAAADRVGADDAVALRQVRGDVVHVAPGARQAVPGDDGLVVLRTPFGVVQLAAEAGEVVRGGRHFFSAPKRSRPTTPAGKW